MMLGQKATNIIDGTNMNLYPKIYLAMDNCVFYKRYTHPEEWAHLLHDLGIFFVEASADTELDPLYMGKDYLKDWVKNVKEACHIYGIHIGNLFSGHGTYTTLGLAHYDERVRKNMRENFFVPMIDICAELSCGLGFYAHAFNHDVLQSKKSYLDQIDVLYKELVWINTYAKEKNVADLSVEKMYTPHQYPWRMADVHDMIKKVSDKSGKAFYFTEDLGHHHIKYIRPSKEVVENKYLKTHEMALWLGSDRAYEIFDRAGINNWKSVEDDMDQNPQLFSTTMDGDCYEILRNYGCYAPIIHLQQTDGTYSEHRPFTENENKKGKINGRETLLALKESFDQSEEAGMPPRVKKIYLTLELFSSTTSIMHDVLNDCKASVNYWRKFIPEDGLYLDELINNLN